MALELGKHSEECRDNDVVDDQEERDDYWNGKVGKVSATPITALIIAEVPQVGLAEAGKIVAITCNGTVCAHLATCV